MSSYLYIFAGFPGKALPLGRHIHAGGLQHCIENVEELAILENSPHLTCRKEGVFLVTETGEEWQSPVVYRMSNQCVEDGITWDWFPEGMTFGNGVTIHKTLASPDYKTVVYGTDLTMDQLLTLHGPSRLADLKLHLIHNRHEGWEKYEARWLPGTCPQENHVVHLTWLVTVNQLPDFAYERIRSLVEDGAEPRDLHLYSSEPGRHFSEVRRYNGESAHGGTNAVPSV